MDVIEANFLERSASIICDTCEMGCCISGCVECVEHSNIKQCGLLKEKQNEMLELFCETAKLIFQKNIIGGGEK